jgi:hypothetical protein
MRNRALRGSPIAPAGLRSVRAAACRVVDSECRPHARLLLRARVTSLFPKFLDRSTHDVPCRVNLRLSSVKHAICTSTLHPCRISGLEYAFLCRPRFQDRGYDSTMMKVFILWDKTWAAEEGSQKGREGLRQNDS